MATAIVRLPHAAASRSKGAFSVEVTLRDQRVPALSPAGAALEGARKSVVEGVGLHLGPAIIGTTALQASAVLMRNERTRGLHIEKL